MDARFSGPRATVLVLSGDPGLLRLARSVLEPERKVVGHAPLTTPARRATYATDIVVADLDTIDSQVIMRVRRACPGAAVIVLSPARREADCIAALELDADYLARPFGVNDLAARVRVAELKRFASTGRPRFYRRGPLTFDALTGGLSIDGRTVPLAHSELVLFARLAEDAGVVVAYERLLAAVGLSAARGGRPALRSCVLRLRRKIEREPVRPEILTAELGVGYRLAPSTAEPPGRPRDPCGHRSQHKA